MKAANRYGNFDFPGSILSIECITHELKFWEAKNAYLQLIKNEARKYLDSNDDPPTKNLI